jgi:hypothetical protein
VYRENNQEVEEKSARYETGGETMSETIQRYGIGVIGGEPYSELGRLVIDLVFAKNGIAVLHADHQREVAALRSECELLRSDASWAATHRSELESLRKAFAEAEAENATLRAKNARLRESLRVGVREASVDITRRLSEYPAALDDERWWWAASNLANKIEGRAWEAIDAAFVQAADPQQASPTQGTEVKQQAEEYAPSEEYKGVGGGGF